MPAIGPGLSSVLVLVIILSSSFSDLVKLRIARLGVNVSIFAAGKGTASSVMFSSFFTAARLGVGVRFFGAAEDAARRARRARFFVAARLGASSVLFFVVVEGAVASSGSGSGI